ncbi:electron transfer flavoprotein subunit alpha [Alicyclobacillus sacchari]|nr:electron transfer flavoprotein subunit alpha [Alicyclobacillus sacchari]
MLVGGHVDAAAEQLADHDQSQVVCVAADTLASYDAERYFAAVQPVVDEVKPDVVILGHTASGRDLAPKIACHLDAGQVSDVVAIEGTGAEVTFKRPIYAGKAFETKRFLAGPWVVTIRPNNLQADAKTGAAAPIVKRPYADPAPIRTQVVNVQSKSGDTRDLTEAKVVVSGGRGVRSAEGFAPLAELAELLDGALGASRAACDAGYCDYSLQIGQISKVVTPDVYIACGISGAIQHLVGMSQSKLIIAINKDGEAPIFDIADYGVVGDLFEIIPKLTAKLREKIAAVRS